MNTQQSGAPRTGKVVIIGTGAVGSTFAYALQIRGAARDIVLLDIDRERAEGQASDLNHGLFFTPTSSIRVGEYEDCADADVIVLTAGANQEPGQSRMDLVETNVDICRKVVKKITEHTSDAILVVATNPVDVITYAALKFSGFKPSQVIGSGTMLDSARFRYFLSQHCQVDASNVHAYVLGEHGDSEVVAWSTAALGGTKLEEACATCERNCPPLAKDEIADKVRTSAYHIIEAKGATNFAIGLVLTKLVTSIIRNESSVLTVSTLMQGQCGLNDVCLSIPRVVNRNGAQRSICPSLNEEESKALEASAKAIRKVQEDVGLTEAVSA